MENVENILQASENYLNQQFDTCVREGCSKPPIDNQNWEHEFCSDECAVIHCKFVFANWVKSRQMTTTTTNTLTTSKEQQVEEKKLPDG